MFEFGGISGSSEGLIGGDFEQVRLEGDLRIEKIWDGAGYRCICHSITTRYRILTGIIFHAYVVLLYAWKTVRMPR